MSENEQHQGDLRTYISFEGLGKHYTVKVGKFLIWTHSFAMDGPIDPATEHLFLLLHEYSEVVRRAEGLMAMMERLQKWSAKALEPEDYWGDRYLDVLHERVDGFLSGVIVGIVLGVLLLTTALVLFGEG